MFGIYSSSGDFSILHGKTLVAVDVAKGDDHRIIFTTDGGERYLMHHLSDCCETVEIEDICGDMDDLLNSPIVLAEEVSHQDETPEGVTNPWNDDSFTWTFYKLATIRGAVTIRWFGSSNGYYSESVDFEKIQA